jgi:RNA polymerase sigma-70 factor (ECF subfamily)
MTVAQEASGAALAPAVSETAERLFQEHSGWIYGYCLRFLRSPEEAEDALQATYLNACRSLGAGVRPTVGSAWLLRIAQNVCLTRLRASGRRHRLEHVQDVTILEETIPAPDRPAEELIGLTGALASLPDRQRHAILLREWQGLSHREVARRLGLTEGAAETLIFRARRSLAAALENPGARGRKTLRALDVGGLVAAVKSFVGASAAVKTVAAVTVVAATTTVVATDPAGVWRARPDPVAPKTTEPVLRTTSAPYAASSGSVWAPADATRGSRDPEAERSHRGRDGSARGREFGQATAAAAKAKDKGTNNGLALGHEKKASASPKASNAQGPTETAGRPSTRRAGPPAHAQANGLAKGGTRSRSA